MPPSTLIRLLVPRAVISLGAIDTTQPIGREREREREGTCLLAMRNLKARDLQVHGSLQPRLRAIGEERPPPFQLHARRAMHTRRTCKRNSTMNPTPPPFQYRLLTLNPTYPGRLYGGVLLGGYEVPWGC